MASENKKQQQKVNQLIADLRSMDDHKIGTALKAFQLHGDASIFPPLMEVWRNGLNEENHKLLVELLEGLKSTGAVVPLMEEFRNPLNKEIQRELISAFWNSKLDFSPYLSDFVLFAIDGDFLDAFEALTLIEQFETEIPEAAIMEAQLLLTEYYSDTTIEQRNEQKEEMLKQITLLLRDFDQASGTDGFDEMNA